MKLESIFLEAFVIMCCFFVCYFFILYFFGCSLCAPQLHVSDCEKVSSKWLKIEAELLRERAVFGPGPGVLLSRGWVQDAAEGPNRTRARIRRKARRSSKRVQPPKKTTNHLQAQQCFWSHCNEPDHDRCRECCV